MLYLDATDMIVGRLASRVAKMLLMGEEIMIFNAEKAVITGTPEANMEKFHERIDRGDPYHGPFFPKRPDRILKRTVRGMLPYKKPRGRDALKRLKVFNSVPEEYSDKELKGVDGAENQHKYKYITLGRISQKIGGKI